MINENAKLTFNHLSKDLQKAYLECKEDNYFYSNKAFNLDIELYKMIQDEKKDFLHEDFPQLLMTDNFFGGVYHENELNLHVYGDWSEEKERYIPLYCVCTEGGFDSYYRNIIPAMMDFLNRLNMLADWIKEKLAVFTPDLFYSSLHEIITEKYNIQGSENSNKLYDIYNELNNKEKEVFNKVLSRYAGISMEECIRKAKLDAFEKSFTAKRY